MWLCKSSITMSSITSEPFHQQSNKPSQSSEENLRITLLSLRFPWRWSVYSYQFLPDQLTNKFSLVSWPMMFLSGMLICLLSESVFHDFELSLFLLSLGFTDCAQLGMCWSLSSWKCKWNVTDHKELYFLKWLILFTVLALNQSRKFYG